MAEDLSINKGTREEQYQSLLPQISAIIEGEPDLIANLSNITAALKEQFNWWWVGFYLVKNDELVLGPFQGPVACTRIKKGRGVCGTAWLKATTLIVPDVQKFPGHIACSSVSKSEIVVPVIHNNVVVAVLDADSEHPDHFDATDQKYLEQLTGTIVFNAPSV
ncbi:diguanylate cyclase [Niabella ginsenosidivorans]|uniref:Diguanylate cyclase n=1 Tax=Niabella ginsenosidivorans TaxID=1176587 RepID=A0A1A9HZ85_9BACT|nr:GAF domain-containing protein [Niabella ginsenosidivorans]ANH80718.1 diguanylate cyclase [Niabella ginsenosidivorans]